MKTIKKNNHPKEVLRNKINSKMSEYRNKFEEEIDLENAQEKRISSRLNEISFLHSSELTKLVILIFNLLFTILILFINFEYFFLLFKFIKNK